MSSHDAGRLADLHPEKAAELLAGAGVPVHNLAGGMTAWAEAGLPVITDDGQRGAVA